jgi:diguanylate cyclase (GGDEF)-like protein
VTLIEKKKKATTGFDTSSTSELMSAVLLLTDSLEHAIHSTGPDELVSYRIAIDAAQSAAGIAETQLAECLEGISVLEQLAITDELTSILNRRGFLGEFHRALSSASRYNEQGVLVYIDLDDFKPVNDTFGHAAGDEVLRQVTAILLESVRGTDVVARLGGDEFAVLLTRTKWEDSIMRIEQFDRSLNKALVIWEDRLICLSASIGVQIYGPEDQGDDLLNRADTAMYEAKKSGTALPLRHATA